MKPVKQTLNDDKYGNCLQACVASVLDKELHHVPNFMLFEEDWWYSLVNWCRINKLSVEYIEGAPPGNGMYYVTSLKFKRHSKDISHVVITKNGVVAHDPWVKIDYDYNESITLGYYDIQSFTGERN